MDVRLSPEQQALADAAAHLVDRLGPRTVAGLDDAERSDKLDAAVAAAGWRELRVAEGDGAPLGSGVEVAIVGEELGRGLADASFLGPTLAAELRRLVGAPPAASIETVALDPGWGALAVGVDDTLVTGAVAVDASRATSALVLVPGADGHGLGQVGLGSSVVRRDLTRPSVICSPGQRIEPVAEASGTLSPPEVASWTALGLALACADLVGVMRGAIDLAVAYATSRQQFGRPVGSFQAVQHLLADALVLMEGSRSTARHAAWAADSLPADEALAAAAVAKAYGARAARTVCETAIQVHGGIGNTWECLAHVFLRRALLSGELLGGVGDNLDRVLAHNGIGDRRGLR